MALRLLTTLVLAALAGCGAPEPGTTSAAGNGYAIYGAVERPGARALGDGDFTLLEAVLAARPIPGQADLTRVMVMREVQGAGMPQSKRILELNPDHAIVATLEALQGDEARAGAFEDSTRLLHGQALIAEGSPVPDPAGFAQLVTRLLVGDQA